MKRFYLPEIINNPKKNDVLKIPKDLFHRLTNVLRLRDGDEIEFIDGLGLLLKTIVQNNTKEFVVTDVLQLQKTSAPISIACSLLRRERFDLLVEKAVELGVDSIIPFTSQYSRPYSNDAFDKLQDRWQRIADQTISQCKRDFRCIIEPVSDISQISIYYKNFDKLITFHPESDVYFHGSEPENKDSALFIFGPEGGFSDKEITFFSSQNIKSYKMSQHLLRAETAVMYSLSIIDYMKKRH